MGKNKKIHFEVSERKVLLRFFDVLFVLVTLYFVGQFFDLQYLKSSSSVYYYAIVLAIYINIIGTVFEMYNLQVSSNQFKVLKSTILTVSLTVLFYLLTPVFSAELPKNRFQILIFFFTLLFALVIWRIFYVRFLASNRFVQNVLIVCDRGQLKEFILSLENSDPHYRIVAYVNSSSDKNNELEPQYVQNVPIDEMYSFVKKTNLWKLLLLLKIQMILLPICICNYYIY